MWGVGFRGTVWGFELGCGVASLGFRIRVSDLGFRVSGVGRVYSVAAAA